MVEIHQVSRLCRRGVDEVHALENVSLTIADGTFVALEDTLALLRPLKNKFHKTVLMVTHDSRAPRYVDQIFHREKRRLGRCSGSK